MRASGSQKHYHRMLLPSDAHRFPYVGRERTRELPGLGDSSEDLDTIKSPSQGQRSRHTVEGEKSRMPARYPLRIRGTHISHIAFQRIPLSVMLLVIRVRLINTATVS